MDRATPKELHQPWIKSTADSKFFGEKGAGKELI